MGKRVVTTDAEAVGVAVDLARMVLGELKEIHSATPHHRPLVMYSTARLLEGWGKAIYGTSPKLQAMLVRMGNEVAEITRKHLDDGGEG